MSYSMEAERQFGPVMPSTNDATFDFTLLFEESILTALPLGFAVLWSIQRLWTLHGEVPKVRPSWLLASKLVAFACYLSLQMALLILWERRSAPNTRFTLACNILMFVCSIVLMLVSYFEHTRSIRPSTLLIVYIGLSLLLDVARLRTLFLIPLLGAIPRVFFSSFVVKFIVLILEIYEKRRIIRHEWKTASPEATGSVVNRSLFLWLNKTLMQGFRTILTADSLPQLDNEILSASDPNALMAKWRQIDGPRKHSLFWLYIKHYKTPILGGVLPRLVNIGFTFSQPYLIQRVVVVVAERNEPNGTEIGYALVGAYALVYIGMAISFAVYQHKTYRLLTLFRGSLITMVYDKVLRMNSSANNAEAITLMSADIDRITGSMHLVHELYASVIEVGIAIWLLYDFLGISMVAPIAWMAVCLLAGIPIARASANAQVPWLEAIEDRLASTVKTLGAMKGIRVTGLADIISARITDLRMAEIRASWRHRFLNVFIFVLTLASSGLTPIWTFMTYILIEKATGGSGTLTESVAFATLSLLELVDQPLMYAIEGTEDVKTALNCFDRIQEYLTLPERQDYRVPNSSCPNSSLGCPDLSDEKDSPVPFVSVAGKSSKSVASIRDVSAQYVEGEKLIGSNWTFDIAEGKVTMIYGVVGCGKSTLLKVLLGEVPIVSGSVSINFCTVSYCPQAPWTNWGTIRSNIIGMSDWDAEWYKTVVYVCALSADLDELPEGDQTHVGSKGSKLSGGQQIRLSLARALYARSSTLILDDVVAGLDRNTEHHILNALFGSMGLLNRSTSTTILATSSAQHLRFADNVIKLSKNGNANEDYALVKSKISEGDTDKTIEDNPPPELEISDPELELPQELIEELAAGDRMESNTSRRTGELKIYAYYAKAAGWWLTVLYLLAVCLFVFGVTFPSVWVQWWTNANEQNPNEENPNQRLGYWLGIYAALGVFTIIACAVGDCTFNLVVLPRTSKRFHQLLLDTSMRAHTSFLSSTDAGTTLNRFSQDLELIDNDLPQALDSTVFQFFSTIVSIALIFIGANYTAAAIPLCFIALFLLQLFYLRTSRQMRLLDIQAKAPLFSQFIDTVRGVVPIRAYGWTQKYMERHLVALNISQRPYYFMFTIQRWLILVLDLFNAGLAILVVAIVMCIPNSSTAYLGVALFNIVSFSTTLQALVTDWIQVETALGAVSRIRAYTINVKSEHLPGEDDDVPDAWPQNGAIVFNRVSASHNSSLRPAVKDIDLSINAGERIAICGRTGSGKSSLVSTFLRMMDITSGTISIDDIDISTIPRDELRKRMNALPQEPFFLTGSVRENLNPGTSVSDDHMIKALREFSLWEHFETRDGLDGEMDEDELSHGQRQLFCLARALLRPGKIMIMDEATSSIDSETDHIVQQVLGKAFEGRTVIAIAHKLDTIMDFDRVVILDKGRIIEAGPPGELMDTEDSAFHDLVMRELNGRL